MKVHLLIPDSSPKNRSSFISSSAKDMEVKFINCVKTQQKKKLVHESVQSLPVPGGGFFSSRIGFRSGQNILLVSHAER